VPVTFQIVIFAVIAAVLLFQLYNVLGKKVGRQPEDNPAPVAVAPAQAAPDAQRGPVLDPAVSAAIAGLKAREPNFDPHRFLDGARQAYETIVTAYARGDRDALRPLLTDKVLASFEAGMAARDRQAVFDRGWQLVAHACRLRGAGDHVVADFAGLPVIAVRGGDGTVRAFHNVCRHRAGPIATCDGLAAKALRCRYHGWTYTLDGTLRSAPEMGGA